MKKMVLLIALGIVYFHAFSQYSLTGKVMDSGGNPIPSANVIIENTFQGSFTNNTGEFQIKNVKKGTYNVKVSFIGYQTLVKEVLVENDVKLDLQLQASSLISEEVVVQATALSSKTPVAFSSVNKEEIKKNNLGQDLTYMISMTPSVVVSSDAGAGIGYTGINIRGTDVKRTNVTVNGVPVNDAESHGVFWVNMPDFASSVQNIQIQRGVGSSTNGAGAFGATLNMQTLTLNAQPYAEISSAVGSFNSFKNTISAGTGLINNKFSFDVRLSNINSDGFIDRAYSDLKSVYISGGYYGKGSALKLVIFTGKEVTYQAWNGIPKVRLLNDTAGMKRYFDHGLISEKDYDHILYSDSRTYNFYTYKNEVDNYQQDHYQLHYSKEINKNLYFNSSIHYTYGRGYFEGYKWDKKMESFGLQPFILNNDTISTSDFITQKWLDNDFYGINASLRYLRNKWDIVAGASFTQYDGRHFGDIIWAKLVTYNSEKYRWYYGTGDKSDAAFFVKANYQINGQINIYGDLQYRNIDYSITGNDDDLRAIDQVHTYGFFNPKAGITYTPTENQRLFFSFAQAHREPSRSDFTDADLDKRPKPEKLNDFEAGYDLAFNKWRMGINLFYMNYTDQLIMTGQINNVGAPIMVNVDKSFRRGLEWEGMYRLFKKIQIGANLTLGQHKILNYISYVDDWDTGIQKKDTIGTSNISFSPECVSSAVIRLEPIKNLSLELQNKYVSRQYIDNSSSIEHSLDPYFVCDLIISYSLKLKNIKEIKFNVKVNNLFNHEYETNAWVYKYRLGGQEYIWDGYFTQAGINVLSGIVVIF